MKAFQYSCTPRRERNRLFHEAFRVGLRVALDIGAVERVLADVGVDLDPARVGIADQLRQELFLDVPVRVVEGRFLPCLQVIVERIEVEGVRLVTRQRERPLAVHADGPGVALVEQRPIDHPLPLIEAPVAVVVSLEAAPPPGIPGQLRGQAAPTARRASRGS